MAGPVPGLRGLEHPGRNRRRDYADLTLAAISGSVGKLQVLSEISPREEPRTPTGIEEFDRVLGGGLVPGGVVLIGGDPGIGKSTLLLQALAHLAPRASALYVSGEESAEQVALRARRLESECRRTQAAARDPTSRRSSAVLATKGQSIAVIDSIQTVWMRKRCSRRRARWRRCVSAPPSLRGFAKQSGTTLFLVGHVTKEGALAGPRVLEHMVDTVLYFEGDTSSSFRLIRAFKNRYGAVNELGVFAMTDKGLKGVSNPSAIFLSQHETPVAGSCVLVTQEGTRPLLVEVQALVDEAHGPVRGGCRSGSSASRLAMLLAVLHRHAGLVLYDQDVFVNAVGGVKIGEPAADLAACLAIVSSMKNRALPHKLVVFGEVGLSGELRPAPRGQERLKEAAKLGFTHAIIPKANAPRQAISGMQVIALDRIEQAIERLRELS